MQIDRSRHKSHKPHQPPLLSSKIILNRLTPEYWSMVDRLRIQSKELIGISITQYVASSNRTSTTEHLALELNASIRIDGFIVTRKTILFLINPLQFKPYKFSTRFVFVTEISDYSHQSPPKKNKRQFDKYHDNASGCDKSEIIPYSTTTPTTSSRTIKILKPQPPYFDHVLVKSTFSLDTLETEFIPLPTILLKWQFEAVEFENDKRCPICCEPFTVDNSTLVSYTNNVNKITEKGCDDVESHEHQNKPILYSVFMGCQDIRHRICLNCCRQNTEVNMNDTSLYRHPKNPISLDKTSPHTIAQDIQWVNLRSHPKCPLCRDCSNNVHHTFEKMGHDIISTKEEIEKGTRLFPESILGRAGYWIVRHCISSDKEDMTTDHSSHEKTDDDMYKNNNRDDMDCCE